MLVKTARTIDPSERTPVPRADEQGGRQLPDFRVRAIERMDRALNELIQRAEGLLGAIQGTLSGRAGEAGAFFRAFRAFFSAFRPGRPRRGSRAEDEEAMFI